MSEQLALDGLDRIGSIWGSGEGVEFLQEVGILPRVLAGRELTVSYIGFGWEAKQLYQT